MSRNNNQPPGQVPDYRLQQMTDQMRRMEEDNRRMRQMLDQMTQRQAQPQQQPESSPFAPEVDQAIQKKFQSLMQPIVQQTQGVIGQLADRNDYLEFNQKYGFDTLQKYQDRIEQLREQRRNMGQYISREDAYKHIYFEETNRKPQPKPEGPKGPVAPYVDPYTGQVVVPQAQGLPQAPEQEQMDPQQVDPNQPQQFQTQVPQQPQMQPQQFQPQQQFQQPQQFAQQAQPQQPQMQPQMQSDIPVLPNQGINPTAAPAPQGPGRVTGLDIEADTRNLDGWAQKYGDLPL